MATKAQKMNLELKELVKHGTDILNEIRVIDDAIESTNDSLTKFELKKAKADLQEQFNIIFDMVFGGEYNEVDC